MNLHGDISCLYVESPEFRRESPIFAFAHELDVCSGVRTNGEVDWKKLVNFIQAVGAVDATADRKTIKPDWTSFFALAFGGSTDFLEERDDSLPQSRGPL